jgi:dTDP-4-dehydrorhamnose 3,5-epimerase
MRPDEPTYLKWFSFHLTSAMNKTLHIPAGLAHGFLTLEPNTIICYVTEAKYDEMQYGRVRWNDPVVGIKWPFMPSVISQKDKEAELLIAHI